MAQLLIRMRNKLSAVEIPLPGQVYGLKGDIVTVVDDAHIWGSHEDRRIWEATFDEPWNGSFAILQIEDVPKSDAIRDFVKLEHGPDPDAPDDADKDKRIISKSLFKVLIADLPAGVKSGLENIGFARAKNADVRLNIRNKTDNSPIPDRIG